MMITRILSLALLVLFGMQVTVHADKTSSNSAGNSKLLEQDMNKLDGTKINLAEEFAGKVILFVNVASKCGKTPQYEQLEALHEKYGDQGLVVVGVPCNQFGGQEPGSAKEIATFCTTKYGVKFVMLEKVDVNGDDACPLYKFLTSKKTNPEFSGKVEWNFTKFLIDRNGTCVARFEPGIKPDADEVVDAIETELAKKAVTTKAESSK